MTMGCPECREETDPRRRLLESLCPEHQAQVQAVDEEALRRAIEQGMSDARAVRAQLPTLPGYYRA
jgi:hypothetical protein